MPMANQTIKEIYTTITSILEDKFKNETSGHDIYHLDRVFKLAMDIHKYEGGDPIVIAAATLVHDIHRIIQNETGQYCKPVDSLQEVFTVLDGLDVKLSEVQYIKILHCVEYHEGYSVNEKAENIDNIEALIVQDADRLDELGAIGIARTFTYGGKYGEPIFDPNIPLNIGKENDELQTAPSTIHFIRNKFLKVKENLHTDRAKQIAEKREQFTRDFIEKFSDEWEGIDYDDGPNIELND